MVTVQNFTSMADERGRRLQMLEQGGLTGLPLAPTIAKIFHWDQPRKVRFLSPFFLGQLKNTVTPPIETSSYVTLLTAFPIDEPFCRSDTRCSGGNARLRIGSSCGRSGARRAPAHDKARYRVAIVGTRPGACPRAAGQRHAHGARSRPTPKAVPLALPCKASRDEVVQDTSRHGPEGSAEAHWSARNGRVKRLGRGYRTVS